MVAMGCKLALGRRAEGAATIVTASQVGDGMCCWDLSKNTAIG